MLYADRCVMCSRCVRFTQEISGTHELSIINRGVIDVFPGFPLDNPMQGNVVDICPVGCLLDKDFLFKRRVWELKGTPSICPGCATGCSIRVDHADNTVYRLKPRHNEKVNDWWMCDEGRFGFKYVHDEKRITSPVVRRGREETVPNWEDVSDILRFRFEEFVRERRADSVAAVLSPFMSCEEAWLVIQFIRNVAPESTLVMGPVPMEGEDQQFPLGATGDAVKFTILKEKCPNRRGIEKIIESAGGNTISIEQFIERTNGGDFKAAWISGGYPNPWVDKELGKTASKFELLIVHDLFESELSSAATIVLPACAWVEREGSFINAAGLVQPFERAIQTVHASRYDGQYLFELAGYEGLYSGERVREMMAESDESYKDVYETPVLARYGY